MIVLSISSFSEGNIYENDRATRLDSDQDLGDFVVSSNHEVYVGGTNVLYHLDWNLNILESVKTGPELDSARCHASGSCPQDVTKSLTNNINKALVIDDENNKLIVCGSIRQGSCSKYQLQNISSQVEFLPEPVAANDAVSSTFAFIGPQRYNRWGHGNVLYVGTTFTHHGVYRQDVPAISSRNLHDLQFKEWSFSKQSLLRIDVEYRDRFLVNYVYGFNSSSHIYFVTIQKRSHLPEDDGKGYITRLARVCVTDANYDTYTEVTLECSKGGKKYNLVKDAYFVPSSDSLGQKYSSNRNDSFLIGSFSSSRGSSNIPQNESAICVFSLSNIEKIFSENIQNCFNGSMHHRNMEYVSGPIHEGKCLKHGSSGNIYNFCEVGLSG